MTVHTALQTGRQRLAGISDAADLDTQWLLLHVLGQTETSWLFSHNDISLTPEQHDRFKQLLNERQTGKPLAYILGTTQFYGRDFIVNQHVLVPRPATEDLVDQALMAIRNSLSDKKRPLTIADIGTGSGCIAITLALELTMIDRVYATDISPAALDIARQNVQRHGITDRITFLEGNLLTPVQDKNIDLIVSNPPYVPSAEVESNQNLHFEPRLALDGGADGQDFIKQIQASGIPAVVETTGGTITLFSDQVR